jgi:sigma-E factor negative regulatory protein RseA
MSEQIREQVSAFLDGELPNSETELLLKRLARDAELRESFGRYALIGETLRGAGRVPLSRGFAARVNRAINGEPVAVNPHSVRTRPTRWWRPIAGAAVAAGVAAVAVVALQQRAVSPALRAGSPVTAQNLRVVEPKESPLPYIVPAANPNASAVLPAARLTSYVFAHSNYPSILGQSHLLSDFLAGADDAPVPNGNANGSAESNAAINSAAVGAGANEPAARQPPQDAHIAP